VNLTAHALWLLCTLGATIFAAASDRWTGRAAIAVGFGFAAFFVATLRVKSLPLGGLGAVTALVAAAELTRADQTRRWRAESIAIATGLCAGVLAASWGWQLHADGLSWLPACVVAAWLPAASAWLAAQRPEFAPLAVREEALLVGLAVALATATVPSVLDGWRSAVALNIQGPVTSVGARPPVPVWALALTVGSAAAGALYSWYLEWRRG
jgi:hypothetical protein